MDYKTHILSTAITTNSFIVVNLLPQCSSPEAQAAAVSGQFRPVTALIIFLSELCFGTENL